MKPALLFLIAVFPLSLLSAQDISIFSFLESRASINIKSDNLPAAVGQLISQMRETQPEVYDCKFVFSGTHHKTPPEEYNLVMKDARIGTILDQFGQTYGHRVRYDLVDGSITFTAATSSGADPRRKYRFSGEISKAMALDWSSTEKLEESFKKHKLLLGFSDVDLTGRTLTASGSLQDLDLLDMVIAVHGMESAARAGSGEALSEQAIRESFTGRFGAVRILHSTDKEYLVAAHDRASGAIMEDIHLYSRKGQGWDLLATVQASTRAAATISTKDGTVTILDSKEEPITTFHPR